MPVPRLDVRLRGRLLRAPLIEGRDDFDQGSCALPEVATEVWQGFLFVNLDGRASPLAPRLEGLVPLVRNYHMEDMVLGHCETESWDTNWKCLTENFMEGYHLSHVHYETLHPVTPRGSASTFRRVRGTSATTPGSRRICRGAAGTTRI